MVIRAPPVCPAMTGKLWWINSHQMGVPSALRTPQSTSRLNLSFNSQYKQFRLNSAPQCRISPRFQLIYRTKMRHPASTRSNPRRQPLTTTNTWSAKNSTPWRLRLALMTLRIRKKEQMSQHCSANSHRFSIKRHSSKFWICPQVVALRSPWRLAPTISKQLAQVFSKSLRSLLMILIRLWATTIWWSSNTIKWITECNKSVRTTT